MLCNPPACRASIERCCSKSHLGGLAGVDGHCQSLAAAAGSGNRTWRAYLSTARRPGGTVVDARDRIGAGPWFNAEGVPIAQNVEELHGENNLNKETALDELGALVNGRGDSPNRHDILTGSQLDGTAFTEGEELTCDDWNSSGDGSAQLGHHDRRQSNFVELSSRVQWLQPGQSAAYRWRRFLLLFCGRFANSGEWHLVGFDKKALSSTGDGAGDAPVAIAVTAGVVGAIRSVVEPDEGHVFSVDGVDALGTHAAAFNHAAIPFPQQTIR